MRGGSHHKCTLLCLMRRAQPWRTNRARVLRANASSAEERLWEELRNRRLAGLKFVRQTSIGRFYVDFLCRERQIVIEVDGATHSTDAERAADKARDEYLSARGYRIIRVHNDEVYENLGGLLDSLLEFCNNGRPSP